MQERLKQTELKPFEAMIPGVTGTNLVIHYCEVHKKDMYFERVDGDKFACAHFSHKPRHNIPLQDSAFDDVFLLDR